MKSLYEKTKRCLNPPKLASIILDSFSKQQTVKLMSAEGAFYPGLRMESVDYPELALSWAGDALGDPVVFSGLTRALDKVHDAEIAEISHLSVETLRNLAKSIPDLLERRSVGGWVWSLLKDERSEAEEILEDFMERFSRHLDRQHRAIVKNENFGDHLLAGRLNKKETERVRKMLADLIKENKAVKALLDKELKAGEKFCGQIADLKNRLLSRDSEIALLKNNLSGYRKETMRRDERIRELEEKAKTASESEERALRSRIHELERAAKKMEHEISALHEKFFSAEAGLQSKDGQLEGLKENLRLVQEENRCLKARQEPARAVMTNPVLQPAEKTPPRKERGRRLGIFVDIRNLRQASRSIGRRVDYRKLLEVIVGNRHLVKAVAYVTASPEANPAAFVAMLEKSGFQTRVRNAARFSDGSSRAHWGAGIAVDVVSSAEKMDLDIIHLAGGDDDFADLTRFLKFKGIRVEASGFRINTPPDFANNGAHEFLYLDESSVEESFFTA